MRKARTLTILFVIIAFLFCIQSPCQAQTILRKLGRGIGNTLTGVVEVPKCIQEAFYEEGPVSAISYGVCEGFYKGLLRTAAGVYEILTFPIPLPSGYAPIVEPEFLFTPDDPYGF